MKEKTNNEIGFYLKIDADLKREFNIKCLENKVNMSDAIKEYMKKYIEE